MAEEKLPAQISLRLFATGRSEMRISVKNEVIIEIKGVHQIGDEKEEIMNSYGGKYKFINGKHYVKYIEKDAETGEENECMLTLGNESIELLKKGYMSASMKFEAGKIIPSYMDTMAGRIKLDVRTKKISIESQEKTVKAEIFYEMWMNEEKLSECEIDLQIFC